MIQTIDKFFVIDFDRCLGNVGANFDLLKKVTHELLIIDETIFQKACDRAEINEVSFNAFDYLKKYKTNINLETVEEQFIKYSKFATKELLEPGAIEFVDFLKSNNYNFCIMSYGEKRWQMLKIIAVGLENIPTTIVQSSMKGEYISNWVNSKNGRFNIPSNCFSDNISKEAKEVILVDDKFIAFEKLPIGARGYLIETSSKRDKGVKKILMPSIVKRISRIDEIISNENLMQ